MNRPAFHVALTVHDLAASTAFYEALFETPPAKREDDYVKFEVEDPALILALNPGAPPPGPGRLSHLGFRVDSDEALDALEARVRAAKLPLMIEAETTCCYARARKVWVRDPDGNDWELYRFLADTAEKDGGARAGCCG